MQAEALGRVPFPAPLNNACVAVVRDPRDDSEVLFASFYSADPDDPPALARIDFKRHRYRSFRQPAGRGSWRILQANDGKLWFGMNGPGQLASFDPVAERFVTVPPHDFEETTILTDLIESDDGTIFASTYPSHNIIAYNPATQRYRSYPIGDRTGHLYTLAWLDDGRIITANGLQHGVWTVDTVGGSVEFKTPAPLCDRPGAFSHFVRRRDELLLILTVDDRTVEIVRHDAGDGAFIGSVPLSVPTSLGRRLFVDHDDELYLAVDGGYLLNVDVEHAAADLAYHIADVPTRVPLYHFLDHERILVTSTTQYYGIYDIGEDRMDLSFAEVDTPSVGIFSIMPHSQGDIYCTSHLGLCLSRFGMRRREGEFVGITTNASGEIYGNAEAVDGRVFGVSYTHAMLTVYDPRRPWRPGRDVSANPRTLGPLGNGQYRPVTGIVNGPGNRMYVGTVPEYGARGGALTMVDPATDTWTVYRHLVKDHSIHGLAVDDTQVFLGTSVQADGFIQALTGDAHFLMFDPQETQVSIDHPVESAESIFAMGVAEGNVYFWTRDHDGGQRFFVYEIDADRMRPLDCPGDVGIVSRRPMARTHDGRLFFGHTCGIAEVDPVTCTITTVWQAETTPWGGPLAGWGSGLVFSVGNVLYTLDLGTGHAGSR